MQSSLSSNITHKASNHFSFQGPSTSTIHLNFIVLSEYLTPVNDAASHNNLKKVLQYAERYSPLQILQYAERYSPLQVSLYKLTHCKKLTTLAFR